MTDETRSGVRQASAEEVMWTLSEAVAEIERLRAEVQRTADRPAWIRNYVECAAERDRLRAAQAWQPIATAPKDGSAVLLFVPGEARWDSDLNRVPNQQLVGRWVDPWGAWELAHYSAFNYDPSHWRSLPDAPA